MRGNVFRIIFILAREFEFIDISPGFAPLLGARKSPKDSWHMKKKLLNNESLVNEGCDFTKKKTAFATLLF